MFVLVYNLRTPLSSYEKIAGELFHPYVTLGLQGVTIIACGVLVVFPLQFSIYAAFCCIWGLFLVIEGGSFNGILIYGLGLLFSLKAGFFKTHRAVKLSFAILLLAGVLSSQLRFGFDYLVETFLDMLAVSLMVMLGVLLYGWRVWEIQKSASDHESGIEEQVSCQDAGMVMSNGQKKILLLPQGVFSQRDTEMLHLILDGQRYEHIAREQKISLSLVKKRVKFLYDHLNQPDRESFMSSCAGYTIELGVPMPKTEPAGNTRQASVPDSEPAGNTRQAPAPDSEPASNIRQFPAPQNSDAP
jgi:hypothetical protein